MAENVATVYSAWGALTSCITAEWRNLHEQRRLAAFGLNEHDPERHAYALRQLLRVRRVGKRIGRKYEGRS